METQEHSIEELISFDEFTAKGEAGANVVDGLFAIARALESCARQLQCLEGLISAKTGEALDGLASLNGIAGAISDGLADLGNVIEAKKLR